MGAVQLGYHPADQMHLVLTLLPAFAGQHPLEPQAKSRLASPKLQAACLHVLAVWPHSCINHVLGACTQEGSKKRHR